MTDHRKLPPSGKKAAAGAQEKARGPAEFQIGPKEPTRAFVVVPWFKAQKDARRKPENRLEEAVGLAAAIDLDIVGREVVMITQARPATLIGTGKLEELGELMSALHVELVVVDGTLTPGQQPVQRGFIAQRHGEPDKGDEGDLARAFELAQGGHRNPAARRQTVLRQIRIKPPRPKPLPKRCRHFLRR